MSLTVCVVFLKKQIQRKLVGWEITVIQYTELHKNILRGMYKFARFLRYNKPSNIDTTKILPDECCQNNRDEVRAM